MRKKIIILIVLLATIGVLAYVFFFTDLFDKYTKKSNSGAEKISTSTPQQTTGNELNVKKVETSKVESGTKTVVPVEKAAPKVIGKGDLENIAASFAERFGSYSNQSDFSNLTDLQMFMTDKMSKWADSYIDDHRGKAGGEIYYGIITKAVAKETKDYNDAGEQVVVLIQTRRREFIGSSNNSSSAFNQNVTITFKKERGAWKVDSATWEGRK